MKFALVVCFAALVACEPEAKPEAEADPALLYGAYGYGYPGYAYGGYPYAHAYAYGKRSADAEPKAEAEADAYYGYYGYAHRPYYAGYHAGYPYTYAGYRGYHWG